MSIASGPITQIAWVTDDIESTERLLSEQFGVGAWTRMPDIRFGPEETTLRGAPVDFTAHISLGYAGDLQLELIQPVSGETIHAEFLAAHGPGLHHDRAIELAPTEQERRQLMKRRDELGGG